MNCLKDVSVEGAGQLDKEMLDGRSMAWYSLKRLTQGYILKKGDERETIVFDRCIPIRCVR